MNTDQLFLRPLSQEDIQIHAVFHPYKQAGGGRLIPGIHNFRQLRIPDLPEGYTRPGRGGRIKKRRKRRRVPFHVRLSLSPFLEPGLQHGGSPASDRYRPAGTLQLPESLRSAG